MSPLPQRKKTAEELAQLRESLGIPQDAGAPAAETDTSPTEAPPAEPETPKPAAPPKPVRSLRKSEQGPADPVQRIEPLPGSKIPAHRHNERELEQIRRQNALHEMQSSTFDPRKTQAHLAIVLGGYLLAFAGAAICFPQIYTPIYQNLYSFGYPAQFRNGSLTLFHPATLAAVAELLASAIAVWVFLRHFYSRHHSAFIAMIAVLVLIFGALHFFPQLLHAS